MIETKKLQNTIKQHALNSRIRIYEKPQMTLLYRKILVTVNGNTNVDSAGKSGMGMCKYTWID